MQEMDTFFRESKSCSNGSNFIIGTLPENSCYDGTPSAPQQCVLCVICDFFLTIRRRSLRHFIRSRIISQTKTHTGKSIFLYQYMLVHKLMLHWEHALNKLAKTDLTVTTAKHEPLTTDSLHTCIFIQFYGLKINNLF